jgi:PBP1b-binding outer membrane lipoprotein LpoB
MMKISYISLIAVASVALSGCASQKESMVTTTDQTEKRVHTQEELKKTGETQTGPALEKVDPAVQVSGGR